MLKRVRGAQEALVNDDATMRELRTLFPNCTRCSDAKDADTGFHDADRLCRGG